MFEAVDFFLHKLRKNANGITRELGDRFHITHGSKKITVPLASGGRGLNSIENIIKKN